MNKGLVFSLNLRVGFVSIKSLYGRVKTRIFFAIVLFFSTLTAVETSFAQGGEVEEVVVSAEYIPDEKLATADISEVLDASDMSITGDSNVGDALKRLPGLSLVGGKFVYIRGLGDRYSSTYFNGTPMPGLDPLSRAVPLDLFDTNVIANTLVQKTYSAEYSAEFTGGAIDIRSAAVPDENAFEFKVKIAENSISTGEEQLSYKGGSRDWTGFDDGTRDLPGIVRANLDSYPNNTQPLPSHSLTNEQTDLIRYSFSQQNNVWEIDRDTNPIDTGFSLAFKRRWDPIDTLSFGVLATTSYDQKWRNRFERRLRVGGNPPTLAVGRIVDGASEEDIVDTAIRFGSRTVSSGPFFIDANEDGIGDIDDIFGRFSISRAQTFERTQREIGLNSLLALGVNVNNTHEFKLTRMLLRQTLDEASITNTRIGNESDTRRITQQLSWIENQIDFTQLAGLHLLDFAEVNWRYSNVAGSRDTPDSRSQTRIGARLDPDRRSSNPDRQYGFLEDRSEEWGIDVELPFTSDRGFVTDFKWRFGYSNYKKRREYESYRFIYDFNSADLFTNEELTQDLSVLLDVSDCIAGPSPDANNPTDQCFLGEDGLNDNNNNETTGTIVIPVEAGFGGAVQSRYTGGTINEAFYVNFDFNVLENLRFNLGARKERFRVDGNVVGDANFDPDNLESSLPQGVELEDALFPTADSSGIYPSFKVTWEFYNNMQLRAAYSETQNRPTLRELVYVQIFNPDDGQVYRGNPVLKISEVESYDLRYEWYFGDRDYLSVTSFKKRIDDPIELNEFEVGEEVFLTWDNEEFGTNEGIEFEIRKYFGEYFSVIGNASRISSRVTLSGETVDGGQTSRPLQGVSDELYNIQLLYKNETTSFSLAWNYFSERISVVAGGGNNNSKFTIREQPRDNLDFNAKHKFEFADQEYSLGFKVTNILEEEFREQYFTGGFV